MPLPGLPDPKKMPGGAPPLPKMGAGDPAASATGADKGGPMSSPMATPSPMAGMEKAARVQVQTAAEILQRELPHFPLDSEEFKSLSSALNTIQKAFGKSKDEDRKLFPAETMNILSAIGPGAASPGQKVLAGAPPPGMGAPPPPPTA